MQDLERCLSQTPKPHLAPKIFRDELRAQLLKKCLETEPTPFWANWSVIASLTLAAVVFVFILKPDLAVATHDFFSWSPVEKSLNLSEAGVTAPISTTPADWNSSESDRKFFENWALSQGLDQVPVIQKQETDWVTRRRFVLQDGRLVEVYSLQPVDQEAKQTNVVY